MKAACDAEPPNLPPGVKMPTKKAMIDDLKLLHFPLARPQVTRNGATHQLNAAELYELLAISIELDYLERLLRVAVYDVKGLHDADFLEAHPNPAQTRRQRADSGLAATFRA